MGECFDIRVQPNAKKLRIIHDGDKYKVYLTAQAHDGLANKQCIKELAKYFDVPKNSIEITKGLKSRDKTIIIRGI